MKEIEPKVGQLWLYRPYNRLALITAGPFKSLRFDIKEMCYFECMIYYKIKGRGSLIRHVRFYWPDNRFTLLEDLP